VPGAELAPGFYGKLPARGDFVSRRLDADFIAGWDAWLQRAMAESRAVLGGRWLECFLSAPVWCFGLPAGMFSKAGWVGLILPSVDRVGRYFPLTIAAPVREESIDVRATLGKAVSWLDSIHALALEALAPELDLDAFDRRLAELRLPVDVPVATALGDDTVPLGASQATFQVWQLPANITNLGLRASSAVWMTRGGETLAPCLAACDGLMSGTQFCGLLDGRWTEHGWRIYCERETPGVDLFHGQGKSGEAVPPLAASPSSENESV
jgi:type VI secretion system protein ImpM